MENTENININSINGLEYNIPSPYDKYFYGKAGRGSENKKTTIIGVIDASGSMSSCWATLVQEWNHIVDANQENTVTIIFSSDARLIQEKYLRKEHLGGSTNITSGFRIAYQEIIKLSETAKDFTIIFVSDGEDNDVNGIGNRIKAMDRPNGVNINLICVGVGKGFPTFIGMELREKFHNGLSSIPAVFLVNDWRTEFESNFIAIQDQYISQLTKLYVEPAVRRLPWQVEAESTIFESSFFYSDSEAVMINGTLVPTKRAHEISKSELEEIFRGWTQDLQLKSIKDNVRKEAAQCVEFMEYLYRAYEKLVNGASEDMKNMTVLQRLELREKKSGSHLIQTLISECKKIRDGVSLKDLSAEEAAKRLAIGTQQGKFHQKALQMRGLDPSEYEKMKEEFLKKLEDCKLNPETKQEPSIILLQTQKEVLMETTLATAVKKCNPYELVEVMPMVGHTLLIKRSDQSMINPYTIHVLSIPKINKVCDTISLVSQGNEMEISIGNDEEEKFNAVIPLFDESDGDLREILRSKLFHVLMTFNVMRNVDTFFYEAYAGLLANTLVRLIKYPDSVWRNQMIDLVYSTFELVYGKHPVYEASLDLLVKDPRGAMVTEHKTVKHKCEDISKMILNLLVLKKRGILSEQECADRIEYMAIEHLGRTTKEGTEIFESYSGPLREYNFKPKSLKKDDNSQKKPDTDGGDKDKTETITDTTTETTTQTTTQVDSTSEIRPPVENNNTNVIDINSTVDINSFEPNKTQSETVVDTNIIDINSAPEIPVAEVVEESLDQIVSRFINGREHLKFDNIKDLKVNLRKLFLDYISKTSSDGNRRIRIKKETFNNLKYRLNLSLFFQLHSYFCPSLPEFDNEYFWVAINHAMKYRDSHDRSVNTIEDDVDHIRLTQTQKYFSKQDKDSKEKLYDEFENKIITAYLKDFKNAMQMIRDFKCSTDILKKAAVYNPDKPALGLLFFGPHFMGKSSLIGRLIRDTKCIDEKLFDYYRTAYKTFYQNRENEPYEWLTDLSAGERCKGSTMEINVSKIYTKSKYVRIYDSPGKSQYVKFAVGAMSLVNHYFLVLEADSDKVEGEIEMLKGLMTNLYSNAGSTTLHLILTKVEKYVHLNGNESNSELEGLVDRVKEKVVNLLSSLKLKFNVDAIPVSTYTGFNIPKLIDLIDSLNNTEGTEDINKSGNSNNSLSKGSVDHSGAKILITKVIFDHFGGKVVYGQVFGDTVNVNSSFIVYPSLKSGKIASMEINYQNVSSLSPGSFACFKLSAVASSIGVDRGTVLHVNSKHAPNVQSGQLAITEVVIEGRFIGKHQIRKRTCLNVEFRFFRKTLQINRIEDSNGNEINEIPATEKGKQFKVTLVPVNRNTYFEDVWTRDNKNHGYAVLKENNSRLAGIGKVLEIKYNTK